MEDAHILLVEDDQDIQEVISDELVFSGFSNIHLAKNGEEAMLILEKEPISIVVSDLLMPKMDGIQLYNELKRRDEMPEFMMVTGSDLDDIQVKPSSDIELIKKPFDFSVLIQNIQRKLEAKRPPLQ